MALTGSTGGLGEQLAEYLILLGAELILIDRNPSKQAALAEKLKQKYPKALFQTLIADMSDEKSVILMTKELCRLSPDFAILNAGAYAIEKRKTRLGLCNVFTINFTSPYYAAAKLLPILEKNGGKLVAVGSIAHRYGKTNQNDIDLFTNTKASKVYGNAKRWLMYSLGGLFENSKAEFSIAHPGITFTNITAHYPKLIFAAIKHPMKVIFMSTRKAALPIILALFQNTADGEWIGPRILNIWGLPRKKSYRQNSTEALNVRKKSDELLEKYSALEKN